MNILRMVSFVLPTVALAACGLANKKLSDYSQGDFVPYERNTRIHIEILLVKNSSLGQAILDGKDNPIKRDKIAARKKNGNHGIYKVTFRESLHYDVWMALERRNMSFSDAKCNLLVTITGVNAAAFGPTKVLSRGQIDSGVTLTPDTPRADTVVYVLKDVHEAASLVLPMGEGIWSTHPEMVIYSKNCGVMNPGSKGKSISFNMGHRTGPHGNNRQPNKAMLVSVLTDK